jgi:MtaA/CmuA family methyltransferase
MIRCARDFDLDWVTVMSDPNAEAEAFGLEIDYPLDNLPKMAKGQEHVDFDTLKALPLPDIDNCRRMLERVNEVAYYRKHVGGRYFIVGWVEGPMAVLTMLRGLTDACYDLYDHEDELASVFALFVENAKRFITRQVEAGADCIGVGDAAASQIGPEFYRRFILPGEQEIASHIKSLGTLAKLHICGNTHEILPDMIGAGYDIVDVDHLAGSMAPFAPLLKSGQVLSGSSDPVRVVLEGNFEEIDRSVLECYRQGKGRVITSAGCEIPGETSLGNFSRYCEAARALSTSMLV